MDKSNLYGYAMSKSLPLSKFMGLDPAKFNLDEYEDDNFWGCVIEVDFEFPKELYELHNDCPLAPVELEIKKEMLYDYQLQIANEYDISIST